MIGLFKNYYIAGGAGGIGGIPGAPGGGGGIWGANSDFRAGACAAGTHAVRPSIQTVDWAVS